MKNPAAALRHLKRSDPILRRLIARVGPLRLHREQNRNQFGTLAEAIIHQQLALKAARTISRRFQQLYAPGRGRLPRPAELQRTPLRKLRAVGLSRQKISYLRDLARRAARSQLRLGRYARMTDEQIIVNLIQVKGIGRWTAEMFLIFCLDRPNVLPVDDLGLQYAIKEAYGLRKLPSAERIRKLAEPWRPYRSIATWYLWRARRATLGVK